MRYLLVGAVGLGAFLLSAQSSESEPAAAPSTQTIDAPKWKYVPSNRELSCYFPERARSLGRRTGEALLDCAVDDRGWLRQCKVVEESPANLSFGAAATVVATRVLVLESVDGLGQPVAGRRVAAQVKFNFVDPDGCDRFTKNQHHPN